MIAYRLEVLGVCLWFLAMCIGLLGRPGWPAAPVPCRYGHRHIDVFEAQDCEFLSAIDRALGR